MPTSTMWRVTTYFTRLRIALRGLNLMMTLCAIYWLAQIKRGISWNSSSSLSTTRSYLFTRCHFVEERRRNYLEARRNERESVRIYQVR